MRPSREEGKAKNRDSSRADVPAVVETGGPAAEAIENLERTMDKYSRLVVVGAGVIEEDEEDSEEDGLGGGEVSGR